MNRSAFIEGIREIYKTNGSIPLHAPLFFGNESLYVQKTIESTFVSSVGDYVDAFEKALASYVNVPKSVSVVNGTAALQVALRIVGVRPGDEVITQSLSFVATANAIVHNHADPVFLDVDADTMGLSPLALKAYLDEFAEIRNDGFTYNKHSGKRIAACVPMHTFGFIGRIDEIIAICKKHNISVVEDAAEALGSWSKAGAAGTLGEIGTFSYNGNKIITAGGGGSIVSHNISYLDHAKHLTTTAKVPHPWNYEHDEVGYNYRMPNLNSALVLGQFENLPLLLKSKEVLHQKYVRLAAEVGASLFPQPHTTQNWNHWLFSLMLESKKERDLFLEETNQRYVMTRPIWNLLHELRPYENYYRDSQSNASSLSERIVNIPSTPIIK
ncbi:MAG: LegC family aminotransferase [Bacteroidetes bacterium]|nr:LegC family aminotransferase [Bacteroidota bacterium]